MSLRGKDPVCSVALMKPITIGGQQTETTTAPVSATPAFVAEQNPEFLDAAGVELRFSIRRSLLYALHTDGHVKSVSLRRRGQLRGKRLFSVDSLRKFLAAQPDDIHPDLSKLTRKAQIASAKAKAEAGQ